MQNMRDYQVLNDTTPIKIWGKYIRLVNEEDAEFISGLRSDTNRTEFMLTLDNDVEKQQQWIREYKIREKNGEDYYFMFTDSQGERLGVIRIYYIDYQNKSCKGGGMIKKRGGDKNLAMAMFLFQKCFVFDVLNIVEYRGDFNAQNNIVKKMHDEVGYPLPEPSDNGFINFTLSKGDFMINLEKVLKRYNLLQTESYKPLKIKI